MKGIRLLALLAVIAGVAGWIITFSVDPNTSPLATAWVTTWIANPIGAILSLILFKKGIKYGLFLLILNLLLIFSYGPIMFGPLGLL